MVKIKIQALDENFQYPKKSNSTDAGFDLTATSAQCLYTKGGTEYWEYGFGFSSEIPPGFCALLFPRSSCSNMDQALANCVGVIDSDYRGEWKARFKDTVVEPELKHARYNVGDRVVQAIIIPIPDAYFDMVEELSDTVRGAGGFGHTGT